MAAFFIAIPVPPDVATRLEVGQLGLETGELVPAENFHVTLAYLGPCHDRTVEDIADGLSNLSAAGFELEARGLGTFGEPPRVLFADIVDHPSLTHLRKRVRRTVAEGGVELFHERFHPHVTLARFGRNLLPEDLEHLRAHIARRMGMVHATFAADRFTLFESLMTSEGRVYDPLVEFPLGP